MNQPTTLLSRTMNRRTSFKLFAAAGAVLAGGTVVIPSIMAAGGPLVAIAETNLYEAPDASSAWIRLIAVGEVVTDADPIDPQVVDGFRRISTQSCETGWALDSAFVPDVDEEPDPVFHTVRHVSMETQLLDAPKGGAIAYLAFGNQVMLSDERQGKYIYAQFYGYDGPINGWIDKNSLAPAGVQVFSVFVENDPWSTPLLAKPNANARVIAPVWSNDNVIDSGAALQNGYRRVQTAYGSGWISNGVLSVG